MTSLLALLALPACGGRGMRTTSASCCRSSRRRVATATAIALQRDLHPKLANSITSASKEGSCAKEVEGNLFSPEVRIVV
jgi:hypothetical protein